MFAPGLNWSDADFLARLPSENREVGFNWSFSCDKDAFSPF